MKSRKRAELPNNLYFLRKGSVIIGATKNELEL